MFYLFGKSKNNFSFIYSENCNLILIEAENKEDLYNKIFNNNEIFTYIFIKENFSFYDLNEKKLKHINQIKELLKENFEKNKFINYFYCFKQIKFINSFENYQSFNIYISSVTKMFSINLRVFYNVFNLFLLGLNDKKHKLNNIKRNILFDKNILGIIKKMIF